MCGHLQHACTLTFIAGSFGEGAAFIRAALIMFDAYLVFSPAHQR